MLARKISNAAKITFGILCFPRVRYCIGLSTTACDIERIRAQHPKEEVSLSVNLDRVQVTERGKLSGRPYLKIAVGEADVELDDLIHFCVASELLRWGISKLAIPADQRIRPLIKLATEVVDSEIIERYTDELIPQILLSHAGELFACAELEDGDPIVTQLGAPEASFASDFIMRNPQKTGPGFGFFNAYSDKDEIGKVTQLMRSIRRRRAIAALVTCVPFLAMFTLNLLYPSGFSIPIAAIGLGVPLMKLRDVFDTRGPESFKAIIEAVQRREEITLAMVQTGPAALFGQEEDRGKPH